jgi:hypothetical protein
MDASKVKARSGRESMVPARSGCDVLARDQGSEIGDQGSGISGVFGLPCHAVPFVWAVVRAPLLSIRLSALGAAWADGSRVCTSLIRANSLYG